LAAAGVECAEQQQRRPLVGIEPRIAARSAGSRGASFAQRRIASRTRARVLFRWAAPGRQRRQYRCASPLPLRGLVSAPQVRQ
jgi:hypothetical protein